MAKITQVGQLRRKVLLRFAKLTLLGELDKKKYY